MPTWLNSASMPKVRASSGTMGTTRWPRRLSRKSLESMRAKAIVVLASPSPVPLKNSSNSSLGGSSTFTAAKPRRLGTLPPSARRRSSKYSTSGLFAPG